MKLISNTRLFAGILGLILLFAPVFVSVQNLTPVTDTNFSENTEHKISVMSDIHLIPAIAYAQEEPGSCSTFDFFCWYVNILEIILVQVTQMLAGLAALILDILIHHSITSASYRGAGFIEAGWEILRDFTNIVFIFALVTIAFRLVLGQDDGKVKKRLINTLVLALVVNFSLFFTYIVIDASNLLAYVFYNKIDAPQTEFSYTDTGITYNEANNNQNGFTGGEATASNQGTAETSEISGSINSNSDKSLSLAIASKINPQDALNNLTGTQDTARLFLIFIVAAINIAFIYVFFSMLLLFLGRTLGLMVLAVLSPIALASRAVGQENLSYVGFNKWLSQLISLAFMAPVFLFFIYLATLFGGIANNIGTPSADAGVIQTTLTFAIPLLVVLSLIMLAKKVSTKLAGELGGMIASYAGKALGGAVAATAVVATGGAAAAGGLARGAGMALSKKDADGNETNKWAKRFQSGGKRLQATNFNFAQTQLGKGISGATGINMGANLGDLSYGRADTAVRVGANRLRTGIDNLNTGKPAAAVTAWEENVQESRDKLTQNRLANRLRDADQADATDKIVVAIDPNGNEITDSTQSNLKDALEARQAAMARRTSAQAKAEKDRLDAQTQQIQNDIDAAQDEIKNLNRNNQGGQNTALIRAKRDEIAEKKKLKEKVEETSLAGQIQQIEKKIQNEKDTIQAETLKDDKNARNMTQNSSITINEDRRKERMDTQATRVGSGTIKTEGKVGGNAKAEE